MTEAALTSAATSALRLSALGIDGITGRLSVPPLAIESIVDLALTSRVGAAVGPGRGVMPHVDADDLASAGWAVVFASDADDAIRDALTPLLDHREQQAGRRYRCFVGDSGYQAGDRAHHFLMRHGAGFGPVDPDQIPYYLLLVGGPDAIPFEVEHQLGVQYAVGRLAFDAAADYRNYAESVLEREQSPVPMGRRSMGVFGACRDGDRILDTLRRQLLAPLIEHSRMHHPQWTIDLCMGGEATKRALDQRLGGTSTPGVLITGCHGVSFAADDPSQRARHGGLLCSDAHSNGQDRPVDDEAVLYAEDIADTADVFGLVAWHIACHSGGVPVFDRFSHGSAEDPLAPGSVRRLTERPFITRLPQRLLAHPRGGAAAVFAHVDRVWGYGWLWTDRGVQHQTFSAVLDEILGGVRVGRARRFFGARFAESAAALAALIEDAQLGADVPALEIARLWTVMNDARGWIVLGDPAVRVGACATS